MGYSAVVLGASGYSGGELLRLLESHPGLDLVHASGDRARGKALSETHPHLRSEALLTTPSQAASASVDVLFSCLPSGALTEVGPLAANIVIDLSDDHRDDPEWTYGLTEHARSAISSSTKIANPGCYPTASLLCLVPFAAAGVISGPLIIDAISGTSGAGRQTDDAYSLSALYGSVKAYGATTHRHVPEIERGLANFGGLDAIVSFTPHLAPMPRGLLVTARAPLAEDLDDAGALKILSDAYADEAFVHVIAGWPETKATAGSNATLVSARVDRRSGYLICSCAIDNLGKGAAGQALQNANLALGVEESLGLGASGVWP